MDSGFCFDFGGDAASPQAAQEAQDITPPVTERWTLTEAEVEVLVKEMAEEELATIAESGIKILRLQPSLLSKEECAFGKELKHTDIINGVYEGGFKLWSCAGDLTKYMSENIDVAGKTVVEAGCGHGVPGISALKLGANKVVFQDYNKEVLKLLTVPNILMNMQGNPPTGDKLVANCEFWSGDWGEMAASPVPLSADIILTTDTLYTVHATKQLVKFISQYLAYPDGVAYVGSKTMYFGCGGGTTELQAVLEQEVGDRRLVMKTVKKITDGMDNDRELIAVTWVQ
eukprot:TRINITY_DN4357_c0_g1_i1.p1 TRINITY_DN4357_c0_g1~~TRINITY_DN4357_c0_g1_i1.p1  ORF type:complete len:286 (+),score=85.94 TRINITY_DN4357_c0_g1_i1:734-1591(+)